MTSVAEAFFWTMLRLRLHVLAIFSKIVSCFLLTGGTCFNQLTSASRSSPVRCSWISSLWCILSAMDDGKITALVLLDLSAAFDTVDHKILLSRLQYHLGIHDIALDWCKSYLLNRPQHVCIGNAISKPVILDYSVPQGSVLGPQWFTIYTSPVRDIILKYNLNYHVYADDTQLYITFKSSQEPADSCITTLEKCIQEIRSWMRQNFLKLNDEKTEFLLFGSRQQLSKVSLRLAAGCYI